MLEFVFIQVCYRQKVYFQSLRLLNNVYPGAAMHNNAVFLPGRATQREGVHASMGMPYI